MNEIINTNLTAGLIFDPHKTAGIIRELHANTLLNMIETGRHLIMAKNNLNHGEFTKWIQKECGFSIRTAQRYIEIAEKGYNYKNKIADMKANAFRKLMNLPEDLFEEVMENGKLNNKTISELSAAEIEKEFEKLKSDKKIEQLKSSNAEKQIKIGREQLIEKDKTINNLENQIEKLKNPHKLNEDKFKLAQSFISEAIYYLQKASVIHLEPQHSTSLIASVTVAIKNIQDSWNIKWSNNILRN